MTDIADLTFPKFPKDLALHGTTDLDVAAAIAGDKAFPDRPDGVIDIGHVGFSTKSGVPVTFKAGTTEVKAQFSAGVAASLGIFPTLSGALSSLNLGETPGLTLPTSDDGSQRFAVLSASYAASGDVDGTHPIGAVNVSLSAKASSNGALAVVHQFDKAKGAATVLTETLESWELPRNVDKADALAPKTWLIGELDGALALRLKAAFGYNVDFVRTAKAGALTGDLGIKIDAAVAATFGIDISGRYLVIVGREGDSSTLRVRLFKLNRKGLSFGIDLKLGVTPVETVTPDKLDDFVATVFGVHGTQIIAALHRLDEWTDSRKSIGEFVAGLADQEAEELFVALTGTKPADAFNAAVSPVVDALHQWESLPQTVSAELWNVLRELGLDAAKTKTLKASLELLTDTDPAKQKDAFTTLLETGNFSASQVGRLLSAAADNGLLALLDRPSRLRQIAQTISDILDGGIVARLQQFIVDTFDLAKVLDAIDQASFEALNKWLVARLAAFIDKELKFAGDLTRIQDAIKAVRQRSSAIYEQVHKALNSRYGLELSQTWERTASDIAVFDVDFDTSDLPARELMQALLADGAFDRVLQTPAGGPGAPVTIHAGVLTHELTRKSSVNLTLPHVDLRTDTMNDALAKVEYVASGGGLLGYQASGNDVVDAKKRYRSALSVSVATVVASQPGAAPDLRVHAIDGTWSHQLLNARRNMQREEFEATTRPFIERYMRDKFGDETTLAAWYAQVDQSTEAKLGNGRDLFGDVCAAYEVTVPATALQPWFAPAADVQASAKKLSIGIQRALKEAVRFYWLTDITRLGDLRSSAVLLTWAAVPPANGIVNGTDVIWDSQDKSQLDRMTDLAVPHLAAQLQDLRRRLEEARLNDTIQFYRDDQARTIVDEAKEDVVRPLLRNLFGFEHAIVSNAASAYQEAQRFMTNKAPSDALVRLADFAGDITSAFNTLAGQTVFVTPEFRSIAQSVFMEAATELSPTAIVRPKAMLTISVLGPASTFDLTTFPAGELPAPGDVAVGERLVNL